MKTTLGAVLRFDPNRPPATRVPTRIIKTLERLNARTLAAAEYAIDTYAILQDMRNEHNRDPKGGAK